MSKGRFGIHGGQYIPETLMNAVIELEQAYNHYKDDLEFNAELTRLLNDYANRIKVDNNEHTYTSYFRQTRRICQDCTDAGGSAPGQIHRRDVSGRRCTCKQCTGDSGLYRYI